MDKQETIPEKLLRENNIRIVGEYTASQHHHDMECLTCGNLWSATPKSKTQTFKKNGVSGCPECQRVNLAKRTLPARLKDLERRGLDLLTENYDGRYEYPAIDGVRGSNIYLKVRNIKCGHEFETTAKNLFNRDVVCRVCNDIRKREAFQQHNIDRSEIFQETASEWKIYRNRAHQLTKNIYEEFKNEINPMGLPRTLAGVEGGYHLDHIVPVRWCFDNNMPIEYVARKENLQMLTWEDNLLHKDNLKS